MATYDVIVIGGGICGASIAWQLSADHSVVVLEQESQLGYHSTGRSAAMFVETIGGVEVRALSTTSRAFLDQPPFGESVLSPRPVLHFSAGGPASLHTFYDAVTTDVAGLQWLDTAETHRVCPVLRDRVASEAILEPAAMAIDVHALHQSFLRGLRERGGDVRTSAGLARAVCRNARWTVTDRGANSYTAPIIVNAAGAWSDEVAALAGVRPVGITPYRRTIFSVAPPEKCDPMTLPFMIEVAERFYIKPEHGQLLCSPADESPQPPGDAQPDELEIARALEEINEVTTISSRHVRTSWAGLRSFALDRLPVVGFDPEADGFFWYAGQGGYGVQTSPALSRLGAALIRHDGVPSDLAERGVVAAALAPGRPALRA